MKILLTFTLTFFILIAYGVHHYAGLAEFDLHLLQSISQYRGPALTSFLLDLSALGAPAVVATLTVIATVLLALKKKWHLIAFLLVNEVGVSIWSATLKNLIARDRPDLANRLSEVTGHSFPSGHAFGSTTFYLTLTLMAFTVFKQRNDRVLITGLCATVILIIGFTRLYLAVHFPSDVLGGVLFGVSWTLAVTLLFKGLRLMNLESK